MITAWLVYAGAVSLVLGAAAWLAEYGLRLYGRPGRWVWVGALGGSVVVPLAAQVLPGSEPVAGRPRVAGPAADVSAAGAEVPSFTRYTKKPELLNREETVALLVASYPPKPRNAGVGGNVIVWVKVDEAGRVADTRISKASGHEALDAAALRVAGAMRFTPAENDGRPVAVWIQLPIVFRSPQASGPAPDGGSPR
ncbi:MAG: energy transducer TonB [Gemmatimonadetes bacterium]|nr:energy transducer TonB [Gemmatimonadota bacterium]